MTNYCPNCHLERPTGWNFCYKCGTKLTTVEAMCSCGHTLDLPYDNFCENCGKITARGLKIRPILPVEPSLSEQREMGVG